MDSRLEGYAALVARASLRKSPAPRITGSSRGLALPSSVAARFPTLAALLTRADAVQVEYPKGKSGGLASLAAGRLVWVLTWRDRKGKPFGWACAPLPLTEAEQLHPDHAALVTTLGELLETWGGPLSFLMNQNEHVLAPQGKAFAELFEPGSTKFDEDAYVTFSREANGDLTACHVDTGEVLLLANDPSGNVTPLFAASDSDAAVTASRA